MPALVLLVSAYKLGLITQLCSQKLIISWSATIICVLHTSDAHSFVYIYRIQHDRLEDCCSRFAGLRVYFATGGPRVVFFATGPRRVLKLGLILEHFLHLNDKCVCSYQVVLPGLFIAELKLLNNETNRESEQCVY